MLAQEVCYTIPSQPTGGTPPIPPASKAPKLTITIDDQYLSQAIRHLAADRHRTPREIVIEALRDWLQKQADQEDLAAIAATAEEEAYPWEQVKQEMHRAREKQSSS